jgi:hypothetical protein
LCPHNEKAILISATDKYSPPAKILQLPHYNGIVATKRVKFDDVELGKPNCITPNDAKEIADFIKSHDKAQYDVIIVHCEVGICRSAGICAAIMNYMGEDYMQIFKSRTFKPNIGCYKLVCEAFGISQSNEEINKLRTLNHEAWQSRSKKEITAFALHAMKSTTIPHIIRQTNILITEKFFS